MKTILILAALLLASPTYAQTLTLTNPTGLATGWRRDKQVLPDDTGQSYATVTFRGAYTGAVPANVDLRFCTDGACSVEASTWTACTTPTIAGVAWSCPVQVQNSWSGTASWLYAQARYTDNTAVTSAVSTNRLAAGDVVLLIGQSQIQKLEDYTGTATPPTIAVRFQMGGGTHPIFDIGLAHQTGEWDTATAANADGSVTLANLLGSASMQLQFAVGSTSICSWIDSNTVCPGGYAPGNLSYRELFSPTGGVPYVNLDWDWGWWAQGGSDIASSTAMSYANYLVNLRNVEAWFHGVRSSAPFMISPLGWTSNFYANSAFWDAIRQAQLYSIDNDAGVFWGAGELDLAHQVDGLHLDAAGRVTYVKRVVQALQKQRGISTSGYGPKVASATYNGSTVTVTTTNEGAASLTCKSLATTCTNISGFRIFSNGVLKAVTATYLTQPNQIVLTTGASLATPVTIDYDYGAHPSAVNPVFDDQPPFGDANGLPLQPSRGLITATFQ